MNQQEVTVNRPVVNPNSAGSDPNSGIPVTFAAEELIQHALHVHKTDWKNAIFVGNFCANCEISKNSVWCTAY